MRGTVLAFASESFMVSGGTPNWIGPLLTHCTLFCRADEASHWQFDGITVYFAAFEA